jgi:signal transduction histidine kinase
VTAATVVPEADGSPPLGWRRVFGVPFRAATWRNVVYELLALPLGIAYFVILVAGFSVGAGLAVVIIGLGVLSLTVIAWRLMAGIERGLARQLLRVTIPPPAHMAPGLRPWRRVTSVLRDPVTWKSLVFVGLKFPAGVAAFAIIVALGFVAGVLAASPGIVALTPVTFFGWVIETPAEAVPMVPAGLLGLLLLLNLINGMAWLAALIARVMLGPSTVQLRDRVDDLRHARARIIEAADAERRRLERDLHDGAQQRLVALALTLGVAEAKLKKDPASVGPLIASAREEARQAVQELRELARGLHPALLSDRGLGPALDALAARAPVPVTVTGVPEDRLPPPVEAAAYFVTAESLTNVAKYAEASAARVRLGVEQGLLHLDVSDDGVGGADLMGGTGLRGLRDRVEALDGQLSVVSAPGEGTTVTAEIPLEQR